MKKNTTKPSAAESARRVAVLDGHHTPARGRLVCADGEDERVLRAVQIACDEKLAKPILAGRRRSRRAMAAHPNSPRPRCAARTRRATAGALAAAKTGR